MVTSHPEISIVTVLWKSREFLDGFLDSIRSQWDADAVEIIAVDNDSRDGSVEYLEQRDDVTVIANDTNIGYPMGINRGVSVAQGRFIVICNPDLVFRQDSLAALRDELNSSSELGGVGPVIEVPATEDVSGPIEIYPLMKSDPGLYYGWSFFSGCMMKFAGNRTVNWNFDFESDRSTKDVEWLHGCCAMFKREALNSVGGGFDERFFLYFEDADLGRSLRKAGWRQRLVHTARVLHLEERSVRRAKVQTRIWFMESWHLYQRKHSSIAKRFLSHVLVGCGLTLQLAVQGLKRCLGRDAPMDIAWAYLRTHLSVPFRQLEAERQKKCASLKANLQPLPKPVKA